MNTGRNNPDAATETVCFRCIAPLADSVCLIGDFNAWNHAPDPMKRQPDGSWFLQAPLSRRALRQDPDVILAGGNA